MKNTMKADTNTKNVSTIVPKSRAFFDQDDDSPAQTNDGTNQKHNNNSGRMNLTFPPMLFCLSPIQNIIF
jgi:hypothetical protein